MGFFHCQNGTPKDHASNPAPTIFTMK